MPDIENGTGEGQPADDLRSVLASAVVASEEAARPADDTAHAEPKPKADKPAADAKPEDDAADDKASHDKPEPKKADAKSEDGDTKPEVDAEARPADDKATKADADKKAKTELTGKWSAADKAAFAKLPAEGQDLLLRRHKEMEAAFTRKTQDIAGFRKEYEPVEQLFAPWADKMKAAGFTKSSMIQAWANVEQRLMNPNDAPNVVAGLMKGYRIEPAKVLQLLGIKAPEQRTSDGTQPLEKPAGETSQIQLPQEVVEKLARLDKIEGRLNERDQRDIDAANRNRQAAEQRVMSEIDQFKSAEDGKGNPLHPHFDEVEEAMTHLAAAAMSAKRPVPPLQELYETAVWANPSTREAMRAAEQTAQREKADAEARTKANAARKAASSVTGAPGSGPAPRERRAPERSLREELEANAAENAA